MDEPPTVDRVVLAGPFGDEQLLEAAVAALLSELLQEVRPAPEPATALEPPGRG